MQTTPVAIVGVHLAKKGFALGGGCDLKRLTKQKAKFYFYLYYQAKRLEFYQQRLISNLFLQQ